MTYLHCQGSLVKSYSRSTEYDLLTLVLMLSSTLGISLEDQ